MSNYSFQLNIDLNEACRSGNLKKVKELVDKGANIFFGDMESFRKAAYENHLDVVKYLLTVGAKPEAANYEAVVYACFNGNIEMLQLFVNDYGVAIDKILSYNNINQEVLVWANNYKNSKVLHNELQSSLKNIKTSKTIKI